MNSRQVRKGRRRAPGKEKNRQDTKGHAQKGGQQGETERAAKAARKGCQRKGSTQRKAATIGQD